jgi:hypothetical protein
MTPRAAAGDSAATKLRPRRFEAEEIHLQLHALARLLDGQNHARKCLDAAVEQHQALRGLHRGGYPGNGSTAQRR